MRDGQGKSTQEHIFAGAAQQDPTKLSEYEMDRYMLGLSSAEERADFEACLAGSEMARAQFRRFQEEWADDRFQPGRDRLPSQSRQTLMPGHRTLGWVRWATSFAVIALAVLGGATLREVFRGEPLDVRPTPLRLASQQRATPQGSGTRTPPRLQFRPSGQSPDRRTASPTRSVTAPKVPTPRTARVVRRATPRLHRRRRSRRLPVKVRSLKKKKLTLSMRAKGAPALVVARWRDKDVKRAYSGESFRQGDRLRLAYSWKVGGYVFLAHQEGLQTVPVYPRGVAALSLIIPKATLNLLPGSLEVSGPANKGEILWACFSSRALSFKKVRRAIDLASQKKDSSPQDDCQFLLRFLIRRE